MSADTDRGADATPTQAGADLTKFQTRILQILYDNPDYGLGVKRSLEAYYGEEINHGRLYPNLDTLVNKDLVAKSERDRRTNEYALTTRGERVVDIDLDWVCSQLDVDWIRGDA
jgi:DNA-binding PadR family transcriptional regulator